MKRHPMPKPAKSLLVLLQSGNEDDGRQATLAFATAASASLTGMEIAIFLMGRGVFWAYQSHVDAIEIKGYERLPHYTQTVLSHTGKIFASLPCMQFDGELQTILDRNNLWASVEPVGLDTLSYLIEKSTVITF